MPILTTHPLVQHSTMPTISPASQAVWGTGGAAATANCIPFFCNMFQGQKIKYAEVLISWNPDGGYGVAGVGLTTIKSGFLDEQWLHSVQEYGASPRTTGKNITTELQNLIDIGENRLFMLRCHGNGITGAKIYQCTVTIVWDDPDAHT